MSMYYFLFQAQGFFRQYIRHRLQNVNENTQLQAVVVTTMQQRHLAVSYIFYHKTCLNVEIEKKTVKGLQMYKTSRPRNVVVKVTLNSLENCFTIFSSVTRNSSEMLSYLSDCQQLPVWYVSEQRNDAVAFARRLGLRSCGHCRWRPRGPGSWPQEYCCRRWMREPGVCKRGSVYSRFCYLCCSYRT